MINPAYQAWHCGECDTELEESRQGWVCRVDGIEYDHQGQPINTAEAELGE